MNMSLIEDHLKLVLSILKNTCNKPFVYHSVKKKLEKVGVYFKEIASKLAAGF